MLAVAIIKPHAVAAGNAEKLVEIIEHNGFYINRRKETLITRDSACQLYSDRRDGDGFEDLVNSVSRYPGTVDALLFTAPSLSAAPQ